MTTPEQNPANEQDVQELTDDNLEEASGGAAAAAAIGWVTLSGNSEGHPLHEGRFTGKDLLR
jgi:hypothetical protein